MNKSEDQRINKEEPPFETFEVPDDIFCIYNPYRFTYEAPLVEYCNSSDDESDNGDERDIGDSSLRSEVMEGPLKVIGVLHCCKPIGIIKDMVKHIIPSCNPAYDKCDGGGRKQLDLLTTEARVWWYFKNSKSIMDAWFTYHCHNTYNHETTNWTVHFCNPAFKRKRGLLKHGPRVTHFRRDVMVGNYHMKLLNGMNGHVLMHTNEHKLDMGELRSTIG